MPELSGRQWIALHLGWQAAVSALFVLLASRVIDLGELREALAAVEWRWVPPALVLFTTAKYVDSWRWRYLLRGTDAPPQPALFGAFLIGNMVNNLVPLRAGDVAKIQVLANRYGTPRASLAASVFLVEATLDGVIFAGFLVAAVAFAGLAETRGFSPTAPAAVGSVALFAFALALLLARRAESLPLPERWRERLERWREQMVEGMHALRSWQRTLGAVALSIPAWLIESAMFALMGQAFGLDAPLPLYVGVMVAANVAVSIPVALWNIGPYEAAVSSVLVVAGVASGTAAAYALAVHLLVNLWIEATGLLAFWAMRVRPADVFTTGSREAEG
jgi:uncharacterized protein (TIRG00374 family)